MIKSFYRRFVIYITSLSLVLALAFPASAIVPLVIAAGAEVPIIATGTAAAVSSAYVWGSVIFHAAVAGAIAYYTLGGSGSDSHKVSSSTGDIGRTANVNWVEFDSDSKAWKTMQSPVSVKVPFSTIKTKAENNPSKFPKLKSAMTQDGYINENSISSTNPSSAVSSTVTVSPTYPDSTVAGKSFRLDSYKGVTDSWNSETNSGSLFSNLTRRYDAFYSSGVFYYITYTYVRTDYGVPQYNKHTVSYYATEVVATPVSGSSTPSQFSSAISSSGSITDTAVQSEIDAMIKEYDNDQYSFNILDTSSASSAAEGAAPPFSLPSSALSKPQVDSIRSGQAASDAADFAYKQYSTTKSPADYQKWLDAQANNLAANSSAKPEESPSDVNASITAANGRYNGDVTNPEKSSIQELIDSFISNSPFSSIINATNFSLSGATSSFSVNLRGTNYSIDFSRWQSQLELFGSFILASMHLTAVWIILGRKD